MAIKQISSTRSNKRITRGIYWLLTVVIILFAAILILLMVKHNDEVKRHSLANDYHLAISDHSLRLLNKITEAKLWFLNEELDRHEIGHSPKETPSLSPIQIKPLAGEETYKLKQDIDEYVAKILKIQNQHIDPEFTVISRLLKKTHGEAHAGLEEILLTGQYSSQKVNNLLKPLIMAAHQMERQHQQEYQKINLSFEKFHHDQNLKIISLVIAISIIGSISIILTLRKVSATVAELTNTQYALQLSEKRFRKISQITPVGIYQMDTQDKCDFVNESYQKIIGITEQNALGNGWLDLIYHEDKEDVVSKWRDLMQSGQSFALEHRLCGPEGRVIWVYNLALPEYDKNGTVISYIGAITDISEIRAVKAELDQYRDNLEELVTARTAALKLARDEAERANIAKSEFLSHMSHELRTPMNAILGFGQILAMDSDDLNKTQRGNIQEILDAGGHLLTLINDVLDLAKIETGKLQVSLDEVWLDDILQQSIPLINVEADIKHLQINDNVSNNGYAVKADFTRLKQIFVNLLSNAVKYNREGGQITLGAHVIDGQRLRICISDTGKGLSEEEVAKLFTSFERLDPANNVEGTGIGLVITKHLTKLMDGDIGVESTTGEGSMFWVEFDLFEGAHEGVKYV